MIVSVVQEQIDQEPDIEELGARLCGRTLFVNWPHVTEAKIMSVSSYNLHCGYEIESYLGSRLNYKMDQPLKTNPLNPEEVGQWRQTKKEIEMRYAARHGIDIGETKILVYVSPIIGQKNIFSKNGKVTLKKQWSTIPVPFGLQATVKDLVVGDSHGQYSTAAEVFPNGSSCFVLGMRGQPAFGQQGKVLIPTNGEKVRVELEIFYNVNDEVLNETILNEVTTRWTPAFAVARQLECPAAVIHRVTGA